MKMNPLLSVLAIAVLPLSCSKVDGGTACGRQPVVFSASGTGLRAEVKSQSGALDSFYVSAVEGEGALPAWANERFSGHGSYSGRMYWPAEDPAYSFFASNLPMSAASGGFVLELQNSMDADAVCAYLPRTSAAFREVNTLHFEHVLCRVAGAPSVTLEDGCVLDELRISIRPDTAGIYNMAERRWSGCAAAVAQKSWEPGLLFVPGSYPVRVSWTVSKAGNSRSYSKITPPIGFEAGTSVTLALTIGMSAGQLSCSKKNEAR